MLYILLFLFIYLIGFVVSLILLHKYKKDLDVDNYDSPHESYYDDYKSNAEAYLSFSFIWPLWWLIRLILFISSLLLKFSKYIGKKFGS